MILFLRLGAYPCHIEKDTLARQYQPEIDQFNLEIKNLEKEIEIIQKKIQENIDIFIDDNYKTCKQISDLGIRTFIMNSRLNKDIQDEKIEVEDIPVGIYEKIVFDAETIFISRYINSYVLPQDENPFLQRECIETYRLPLFHLP